MVIIDTSVFVDVFRDRSGSAADWLFAEIGDEDIGITQPVQMELLAGAKTKTEWRALEKFIARHSLLEHRPEHWTAAAKLFYELRRGGHTIRKLLDCCIAVVAIENDSVVLHDDRDFVTIAAGSILKQKRIDVTRAPRHP